MKRKRIFAAASALCMVLSWLPAMPVLAAEASGTCGDNLVWSYSNGTLRIEGSGDMYDYSLYGSIPPWDSYDDSLRTVSLPTDLTHIGEYAFEGCSKLTSVSLPEKLRTIGNSAFKGCVSIAKLTIPENVTRIGYSAFTSCEGVTELNFNAIDCNDFAAFANMPFVSLGGSGKLTVNIGEKVTRIPQYFMDGNEALTEVNILGNKLTHIGTDAFNDCKGLMSIILPSSITRIEMGAFNGCGLTKAIYCGSESQWEDVVVGIWNSALLDILEFHVTHTWSAPETISEATCTDDGELQKTCTVCNAVTKEKIGALGHLCDSWTIITEPGCLTEGSRASVCLRCEETIIETINATGHIPGDEATCTTAQTCTICDAELVAAKGHSYTSIVTAPSCTENGYTTHTCTNCGDSYIDDYVDALGHTEGEVVIENVVEASCTAEGSHDEVVYCITCGEELGRETVAVPMVAHTEGEVVIENMVEATCTEEGSYDEVVYCSVCGEELSRETVLVLPAGHTGGEAVIENVVEATCTEEGSHDEVVYCSVCGEELIRETVTDLMVSHTEGEVVTENVVEATCTAEGSHDEVVYCSVCGEELSRKTVIDPKLQQKFVDGKCVYCGKLLGDVNGDGWVDVEDAMLILQYDAMILPEDGLDLSVGDVSGDGWIDVEDAMLILQYDALLIDKFPNEL